MTVTEYAKKHNLSPQRVRLLCAQGRLPGARQQPRKPGDDGGEWVQWFIPARARITRRFVEFR